MNDTTWFWQIVDARGLADVSSDEFVALNELISKAERTEKAEDAMARELAEARERVSTLEALTATPLFSHRALTAKLHEIIATRFGVRFMGPPDGGDVPAHDQVERMADALQAAERALSSSQAEVRALREALAETADRAFEDAKFAAAEVRPKNDRMDWTEFAKIRDACIDSVIGEIMKAQARTRTALSTRVEEKPRD